MISKELFCEKCGYYTEHLLTKPKTCIKCGDVYDENRKRYVITGPETDKDTIQAKQELLEKDPSAIIIPETVAINHRMKNFKKFPTIGKPKIGRNDRCPCGSGKKYKNCCINVK